MFWFVFLFVYFLIALSNVPEKWSFSSKKNENSVLSWQGGLGEQSQPHLESLFTLGDPSFPHSTFSLVTSSPRHPRSLSLLPANPSASPSVSTVWYPNLMRPFTYVVLGDSFQLLAVQARATGRMARKQDGISIALTHLQHCLGYDLDPWPCLLPLLSYLLPKSQPADEPRCKFITG